jgi:hypothetical protein
VPEVGGYRGRSGQRLQEGGAGRGWRQQAAQSEEEEEHMRKKVLVGQGPSYVFAFVVP